MYNKLTYKFSVALLALSFSSMPLMAQQQNLDKQVLENIPPKCHTLFATWAKAHPTAASELARRQKAHNTWVQKYPQANSELKAQIQENINWAQSHPTENAQIQQFRAECARIK